MAISIRTNIAAFHAGRASAESTSAIQDHVGKLSTGTRLTSAKDDAAGLAHASRLESEFRGMGRIVFDLNRGQSMAKVADAAYAEIENMLQRCRELAVQGANGTYDSASLAGTSDELLALESEMAAVSGKAVWADYIILDDDAGDYTFYTGNGGSDSLTLSFRKNGPVFQTALGSFTSNLPNGTSDELAAFITKLDTAIDSVNSERAVMGSMIKRIDHKINSITDNAANIERSFGVVHDADFASETTGLAKEQILHQAGIAMLAQANVAKDRVIGILTNRAG